MKNLIIFATQHGCTEKCALALKEKLNGETALCRIGKTAVPDLEQFDQIVIGGSIHVGKIQTKLQKFMADKGLVLTHKRFGLFLCCGYDGQTAIDQFNNAFPESLRSMALAKGIFGGEFDFKKMNMLERLVTRKVAKINESQSNIDFTAIDAFAQAMNQ